MGSILECKTPDAVRLFLEDVSNYEGIESVPRSSNVYVCLASFDYDMLDFGPFVMSWDPEMTNVLVGEHKGMWVSKDRSITWDESRGAGPTHWRRLEPNDPVIDFIPVL